MVSTECNRNTTLDTSSSPQLPSGRARFPYTKGDPTPFMPSSSRPISSQAADNFNMQDAEKVEQGPEDAATSTSTVELDTLDAAHAKPSFLDRLPPWIGDNLRSSRSWKTFLRCWIATWIGFILMLPTKSVNTLGFAYVLLPFA